MSNYRLTKPREGHTMNGYLAFYKGKKVEVYAETTAEAQDKAALLLKAKKRYDVHVVLCELNGEQYVHTAT